MCFKSQTPQGDGNLTYPYLWIQIGYVSNHKPRKGTETDSVLHSTRDERKFQITNPARGRKRVFSFSLHIATIDSFKSQTPQGDGNKLVRCPVRQKFGEGFKSQTPQGDGNGQFHFCFLLFGCLFQITNPARGRKPLEIAVRQCHVAKRFKSQTPQGDGNRAVVLAERSDDVEVSNHKPRKGTETGGKCVEKIIGTYSFKSQTPQGDGNGLRKYPSLQ